MKSTILDISKTELKTMFCSPIAWLILIIFIFQVNMIYLSSFQDLIQTKAAGYGIRTATGDLFVNWKGVFTRILPELYLYIPLLTMGAMSKELSTGSIKLLYSSPINDRQIILGKYLAFVIYCFLLLSIILVLGIFTLIFVKAAEIGIILSGFLGLFLLICTYASIGLFISSMTAYQVVAAIGTLAILAMLNLIGGIGQDVEWVRDITYWLSISNRASDMVKGLIGSDDVIYFFVVSGLFLSLSILRLKLRRDKKSKANSLLKYVTVVCLFIGFGYLSSIPKLMTFYDATSTKSMSLTPASQKILSELKGKMTITTYVNILDNNYSLALPSNVNNDMKLFKQYRRYKPEIKMKYVYYYHDTPNPALDIRFPNTTDIEERAKIIAKGVRLRFDMFKSPAEINNVIDLSSEEHRFVRKMTMEDGRSSSLRIFDDMSKHPSETEISAALKRLLGNVPVVGFLTGHNERSIIKHGDGDYYIFASSLTFRNALINQGFDTREVALKQGTPISDDITVLIISDINSELKQWEIEAIEDYIDKGGNMLLACEPNGKDYLRFFEDKLGIRFGDGIIVRTDDNFVPEVISCVFTPQACQESESFAYLNSRGAKFMVNGATWIDYSNAKQQKFHAIPIVIPDSAGCWNEMEMHNFIEQIPVLDENKGEHYLNEPAIVVHLTRRIGGENQYILVLGDADCIGNGELLMSRKNILSSNYNLIMESASWFTESEFPVDTSRPHLPDNDVSLSKPGINWLKILFLGIIPVFLITFGSIKVIRRTRK